MPMDDLKPAPLKRPLDRSQMGGDVAALNALLNMLNDPNVTGAVVPKGVNPKVVPSNDPIIAAENAKYPGISHGYNDKPLRFDSTGATALPTDPVLAQPQQRNVLLGPSAGTCLSPAATPLPTAPATPKNTSKIFFTGLIGAGKDFLAEQIGAKVIGLADPLYHLASYFFGVTVNSKVGKEIPGVRAFLQAAGQWGRGEVNEQYPLTPARACFISMVRSLGELERFSADCEVDWTAYGTDPDIWLNSVCRRAEKYLASTPPDSRVVITNCRFKNEFIKLQESGFSHFHVMASPASRASRVKVNSVAAKDTSEQLASFLDNDILKKISVQPRGNKLRCVWCDSVPSPSPRLYSVSEFVAGFKKAEDELVVTGE